MQRCRKIFEEGVVRRKANSPAGVSSPDADKNLIIV